MLLGSSTLNCDIHNEVFGNNQQYIGRGASDRDDDDDDDVDDDMSTACNPYILHKVEEDDNDKEAHKEDKCNGGGGGCTNDKKIHTYVQALCRGTKNPTLVSLKDTMSNPHGGS